MLQSTNPQSMASTAVEVFAGQSEMRELVFHLAEAIKSDEVGALTRLKEQHETHIREAEEGILRICKKKYMKFLDAHSQMEEFKGDLRQVRTGLGQI